MIHRPKTALRPVIATAAFYFALVCGAGFLLGAIRVPLLVPRPGECGAELREMPFMLVVIYWGAGRAVGRLGRHATPGACARAGVLAPVLLLTAEGLLAVTLAGRRLAEYVAGRDPVSGGVYLGILGLFAAMPWLRRR